MVAATFKLRKRRLIHKTQALSLATTNCKKKKLLLTLPKDYQGGMNGRVVGED